MNKAHQLKPVIDEKKDVNVRKEVVSSLCCSIANYCSPLMYGQTDRIISYHHVTIMKLYRLILNSNTYMTRCEDICQKIGLPMPREALAQATACFIQKVHYYKSPPHLHKSFKYPVRSLKTTRPEALRIPKTEKLKRAVLYAGLKLIHRIPDEMLNLAPFQFKKMLRSMKNGLLSADERRNW